MTHKRKLAVGLGLGVLAVALAGVAVLLRRPDPFRERFDRIQVGMTRQEVEAIMQADPPYGKGTAVQWYWFWWDHDTERAIVVYHSDSDVVTKKEKVRWPQDPFDKLWSRLR